MDFMDKLGFVNPAPNHAGTHHRQIHEGLQPSEVNDSFGSTEVDLGDLQDMLDDWITGATNS